MKRRHAWVGPLLVLFMAGGAPTPLLGEALAAPRAPTARPAARAEAGRARTAADRVNTAIPGPNRTIDRVRAAAPPVDRNTGPSARGASEVSGRDLDPLRELYLAAVRSRAALAAAEAEVRALLAGGVARGSTEEVVVIAYSGALATLRAKHGGWPVARLRDLREGLAVLDRQVLASPDVAEIRYLRLMSGYYLPGILGRDETVREDFIALARLLPDAKHEYAPELYRAVAGFVLANGDLPAEARGRLERSLADPRTGA